jgi:hypothetical protein
MKPPARRLAINNEVRVEDHDDSKKRRRRFSSSSIEPGARIAVLQWRVHVNIFELAWIFKIVEGGMLFQRECHAKKI